MGRQAESNKYGLNWGDVMSWVQSLENTTGRKVTIRMVPWVKKDGEFSISVAVFLMKTLTPQWGKDEVYAHSYYPNKEHRTMVGLVMYLLHEAENTWGEKQRAAEQQARF